MIFGPLLGGFFTTTLLMADPPCAGSPRSFPTALPDQKHLLGPPLPRELNVYSVSSHRRRRRCFLWPSASHTPFSWALGLVRQLSANPSVLMASLPGRPFFSLLPSVLLPRYTSLEGLAMV